ncbi:MAG TPA: hypothetical protein VM577_08005 [Anaerovoracaceae bacterium]|nr:hypothetical protein [Anaerovoracaceae bacterium]
MTDEFEEHELDEGLMKEFAAKLEDGINQVLQNNLDKDPRLELLTTLLSFASQVALDIGIEEQSYQELSSQFYQDSSDQIEEDYLQSIMEPKKSFSKPN